MPDERDGSIDQTVDHVVQASIDTSRLDEGIGETVNSAQTRHPSQGRELPAIGDNLGKYTIEKLLGRGGMGAVFLAHDPTLDRQVAVKIPFLNAGNSAQVLHRFQREARAVAALQHPNICPVYEVTEDRGIHFMVMAYIEGRPLSDYLRKTKRLKVASAINLVRKLAFTLDEAHLKGVIHRDLKPANIMIDARNEPQIMDFGLARLNNIEASQLTAMGQILGTPAYMPPEQVSGEIDATGPSSDIYSLGVMLYQMLTGQLPLTGDIMSLMFKIVNETPPCASTHRESIPPWLDEVCAVAMAKKPGERFASMKAFADALKGDAATNEIESTRPIGEVAASAVPTASLPHLTIDTSSTRKHQVASHSGRGRNNKRNWLMAAAALPLFLLAGGWIIKITNSDGTVQEIVVQEDAKIEIAKSEDAKQAAPASVPTVNSTKVDPARAVAEQVLKGKGGVMIDTGGVTTGVDDPKKLPNMAFTIKEVTLDAHSETKTAVKMLVSLETVTKLTTGDGPHALELESFGDLAKMKTLESLFFYTGEFVDDDRLARLGALPNLKTLNFWYNNITDRGLIHLNQFARLETLNLRTGPSTGSGLEELSPMPTIRVASFEQSPFSDASVAYLDRFPNAIEISLASTNVTSSGVKNFPELMLLTKLLLPNNKLIGDDCLVALKRLPKLTELNLNNTGITDVGLAELGSFQQLELLNISDCDVTPAAASQLQNALPNCKVVANAPPVDG